MEQPTHLPLGVYIVRAVVIALIGYIAYDQYKAHQLAQLVATLYGAG